MTTFSFDTIGIVHSCFKEKFAIPRQSGLAPAATAVLELLEPFAKKEAVLELESVSHIWLQFVFHQSIDRAWTARVRPPRLGGNKKMAVFATRSPVRPNPIGLSVVKLDGIDYSDGVKLHLSGIDLLDGTPVLDIKPYLPYVDVVKGAVNDLAASKPEIVPVGFSEQAEGVCKVYEQEKNIKLRDLIIQVLQQDPRPQYQQIDPQRSYGMRLYDLDVRWRYLDLGSCQIEVYEIEQFGS